MTDVTAIFEHHAARNEAQRRRLIPSYDAFYGAAIAALGLAGRPLWRILVNAEQVGGPTGLFEDACARWHEREAAALGATAEEWAAARERMRVDRWASVEHQLGWLREAGFADADCRFKDHRFAVLVARRAG